MKCLRYSDLIFIATEIAHLARHNCMRQAVSKLKEINSLQAVYAFSFVQETLGTNSNDLKLLMDAVECEMNRESKS